MGSAATIHLRFAAKASILRPRHLPVQMLHDMAGRRRTVSA